VFDEFQAISFQDTEVVKDDEYFEEND